MKRSICYVVPFHTPDDDQHYAHLVRFLTRVAKSCDLHVIVERGTVPTVPGARSTLVQTSPPENRLRRYLELLRMARMVRRAGCRRFFVRISRGAALTLMIARPFMGLEIYYWNSGQVRQAWPPAARARVRLRRRADDLLLRLIVRHVDHLVTGPEGMVEYYVRTYGVPKQNVVTLYNDVDTSIFKPAAPGERVGIRRRLDLPEGKCVLFVGRVSRYKGGEFLLPLDAVLSDLIGTDVQLCVVGEIHLSRLAHQLDRAPRIVLKGPRPNADVIEYMQAADVLVLPSLSEGFPRVVIEAMACGLPVAAFEVGGVRDILGPAQQGFVVQRGDVKSLADALGRILSDPVLAHRLSEENRERVGRFSTERVAQMFVDRIVAAP